jgi:hypothetical protein
MASTDDRELSDQNPWGQRLGSVWDDLVIGRYAGIGDLDTFGEHERRLAEPTRCIWIKLAADRWSWRECKLSIRRSVSSSVRAGAQTTKLRWSTSGNKTVKSGRSAFIPYGKAPYPLVSRTCPTIAHTPASPKPRLGAKFADRSPESPGRSAAEATTSRRPTTGNIEMYQTCPSDYRSAAFAFLKKRISLLDPRDRCLKCST